MNSIKPGITIFTPTYNRAHLLPRLYDSLVKQVDETIEWLVVDDGSTDQTEAVINAFIEERKVCIRYYKKPNGGKHTALNLGIRNAEKEYFFCVDSDDYLEENAISLIKEAIENYAPEGIIAYKAMHSSHERIGSEFPPHLNYVSLIRLINDYNCNGDRAIIHKTALIRTCQIPEVRGQRFFPETYLYDRFDENHACLLLNKALCVCEYQPEGYSSSFRGLMIDNAMAMKMFFAKRIDMNVSWRTRFDAAYRYIAFSLLSESKQGNYSGKRWGTLLIALLPGILMYLLYLWHKLLRER